MKHIHFIGICGTAMAPLAKALQERGWRVTGSDKGIFPPMSDYLRENAIEFYVGFHPDRIGNPECVVVGNYIGPSNPEYAAVRERGIPVRAYPEVLAEYLIKEESIVVAGTYGKTATSALLAWIWETAGRNPSYMSAGRLANFPDGVRITESAWSIVEGDEYPASRWKPVPKFDFYAPKYLLLTGVSWDHADVYLTPDDYLRAFERLVRAVPDEGMIVAAIERPHVRTLLEKADTAILHYNRKGEGHADWSLEIAARSPHDTTLVFHSAAGEHIGPCRVPVLGDQNLDHYAGAVGLARYCGISADAIVHALETFQGVRRRMEVRGTVNGVAVVDDFAHSPVKASAGLRALRLHFPRAKIIAVFEPNVGSRVVAARPLYRNAFADADAVIIPRLSLSKQAEGEEERMDGEALAQVLNEDGISVAYEPDDEALIAHITQIAQTGDVIVFFGSHGFRGMIEQTLIHL